MSVKESTSDRRRSRPVTKRSKTQLLMKNKIAYSLIILIVIIGIAAGAYYILTNNKEDTTNPTAVFNTSMGNISVELYTDKTPITAGNFKALAENDFYDGAKIHRISPGFMIQGGCPNSKDDNPEDDGTGGPGYTIEDEFHDDLSNVRGMISMANTGEPDSGGSQFFILVGDATGLDNKHSVFGKVIDGMDIADAIANLPNDGRYDPQPGGGRPLTDVIIYDIEIVNN